MQFIDRHVLAPPRTKFIRTPPTQTTKPGDRIGGTQVKLMSNLTIPMVGNTIPTTQVTLSANVSTVTGYSLQGCSCCRYRPIELILTEVRINARANGSCKMETSAATPNQQYYILFNLSFIKIYISLTIPSQQPLFFPLEELKK